MARILLVDDLPEFVQAEKEMLTEYGLDCDITTESNPESVLDLLKRDSYDLVVLDIMMPKIDGIELMQQIKGRFKVPVIVYSAYVHLYPYDILMKQGASGVVSKPANIDILVDQIKPLIEDR